MAYERDILEEFAERRRPPRYPEVEVELGIVVEDRASGYCGDIVRWTAEAVTLRDRHNQQRHFAWKPGGFLLEGRPVTLRRPAARREASIVIWRSRRRDRWPPSGPAPESPRRAGSGSRGSTTPSCSSVSGATNSARAASSSSRCMAPTTSSSAVEAFAPSANRRLGVLLDHLVPGSKEQRLADKVNNSFVLVTGHPFVDVWAGIRPHLIGIDAWPEVPPGEPWKEGVCRALGTDVETFWPRLRNKVRSYADLRPELVGAVEQLLDFVIS